MGDQEQEIKRDQERSNERRETINISIPAKLVERTNKYFDSSEVG